MKNWLVLVAMLGACASEVGDPIGDESEEEGGAAACGLLANARKQINPNSRKPAMPSARVRVEPHNSGTKKAAASEVVRLCAKLWQLAASPRCGN